MKQFNATTILNAYSLNPLDRINALKDGYYIDNFLYDNSSEVKKEALSLGYGVIELKEDSNSDIRMLAEMYDVYLKKKDEKLIMEFEENKHKEDVIMDNNIRDAITRNKIRNNKGYKELEYKDLISETLANGGCSYDIQKGRSLSSGFALSIYPERESKIHISKFNQKFLDDYVNKNKDFLKDKKNHVIGLWHDKVSGNIYLDISLITLNSAYAERMSILYNQKAYFDISQLEEVGISQHNEISRKEINFDKKAQLIFEKAYGNFVVEPNLENPKKEDMMMALALKKEFNNLNYELSFEDVILLSRAGKEELTQIHKAIYETDISFLQQKEPLYPYFPDDVLNSNNKIEFIKELKSLQKSSFLENHLDSLLKNSLTTEEFNDVKDISSKESQMRYMKFDIITKEKALEKINETIKSKKHMNKDEMTCFTYFFENLEDKKVKSKGNLNFALDTLLKNGQNVKAKRLMEENIKDAKELIKHFARIDKERETGASRDNRKVFVRLLEKYPAEKLRESFRRDKEEVLEVIQKIKLEKLGALEKRQREVINELRKEVKMRKVDLEV